MDQWIPPSFIPKKIKYCGKEKDFGIFVGMAGCLRCRDSFCWMLEKSSSAKYPVPAAKSRDVKLVIFHDYGGRTSFRLLENLEIGCSNT
jgi:hypothetical protein